jgi:hypothetical protein
MYFFMASSSSPPTHGGEDGRQPRQDNTTGYCMLNREELIAATDLLKRQIEILENSGRYPEAVTKLRAELAELEGCVAEMESDVASRIPRPNAPGR